MDYQYIEGFSIYPSRWMKRYEGLSGYPQKLFPTVIFKNKEATSRPPYIHTFDAQMLQMLNTELVRKDVATIDLPHAFPAGEYLPQLYGTCCKEFEEMRKERFNEILASFISKDVSDIVLTFERERPETSNKKKVMWGISLRLTSSREPSVGRYKTLGYEILKETGKSEYLQVYEPRVPITRVIFGYFKDGLLQKTDDNPDHYTGFFQRKKGQIKGSNGVYVVHYNHPGELPLGNSYLIPKNDDLGIPVPYKKGFVTHMLVEEVVDMSCTPPRHREWFRDRDEEPDEPYWRRAEREDEIRRNDYSGSEIEV
jgi:hypothetical protein